LIVNVARLGRQWFGIFDINLEQLNSTSQHNLGTQVKLMITAASAAYTPPHLL
jgi:hypothetical protein